MNNCVKQMITDQSTVDRLTRGLNIFGRGIKDYKHLEDLRVIEGESAYRRKLNDMFFGDTAEKALSRHTCGFHGSSGQFADQYKNIFNVYFGNGNGKYTTNPLFQRARFMDGALQPASNYRYSDSAQGIQFLVANVEALMAEVQEILYSNVRYNEWLPVYEAIPEGATQYDYNVSNFFGKAGFIDDYGTNAQLARVTNQVAKYPLQRGGIDFQFNDEELRAAAVANFPLQNLGVRDSVIACLQHMEQVILGNDGVLTPDESGLLNNKNVTIQLEPAAWDTLTPDQVIERLGQIFVQISINTNEIFPNKIRDNRVAMYCSKQLAQYLKQPRADVSDTSIWNYFRVAGNNPFGMNLDMIEIQELQNAGNGGIQRAMIGYPDSRDVWEVGVPYQPRLHYMDYRGKYYNAQFEYKLSKGVNLKRPGGLLYVDNVFSGA